MWTQLLTGQAGVPGLMGAYLEHSKNLFTKMQEQMAKQTEAMFPGFTPKR